MRNIQKYIRICFIQAFVGWIPRSPVITPHGWFRLQTLLPHHQYCFTQLGEIKTRDVWAIRFWIRATLNGSNKLLLTPRPQADAKGAPLASYLTCDKNSQLPTLLAKVDSMIAQPVLGWKCLKVISFLRVHKNTRWGLQMHVLSILCVSMPTDCTVGWEWCRIQWGVVQHLLYLATRNLQNTCCICAFLNRTLSVGIQLSQAKSESHHLGNRSSTHRFPYSKGLPLLQQFRKICRFWQKWKLVPATLDGRRRCQDRAKTAGTCVPEGLDM